MEAIIEFSSAGVECVSCKHTTSCVRIRYFTYLICLGFFKPFAFQEANLNNILLLLVR